MVPENIRKGKNRAGLVSLVFLAIILMVASIVLAIGFSNEKSWIGESESTDNNIKTGFACDVVEAQKLYPFGKGLIKTSRDRISYLDFNGVEIFGEDVNMEVPFCSISDGKALVGDTNGVSFLLMDTSRVIYRETAPATIDFGTVNKDGYVALIMDEPGMKGVVRIIKPDGTGIFTWQSAESGYVLSARINSQSSMVDVSIINTDASKLQPILKRFSINGEAVGQLVPQVKEMLPIILYGKEMNPICCGSTNILSYDGSSIKYNITFAKIYTTASSDSGVVLIAKKLMNEQPRIYLIKADSQLVEGPILSEEVTGIAVKDGKAVVGSVNNIICFSIEKLQETFRITINAPAIRVGFAESSSNIVVVARDGVTTFTQK